MDKVLVIVVVYNGMRWLERCLTSVMPGQTGLLQTDVFAVDNDSTDGSADYIASRFPQVHLVRSAENLGFTGGNKLGFEYALRKGYRYVYLLNQDAWLEEGALETLVAVADAHPEYAVLSPLQFQADGCTFDHQFAKLYHLGRKSAQNLPECPESVGLGRKSVQNLPECPENVGLDRKSAQFVAEPSWNRRDQAPSGARPGRVFAGRQIRKGEKAAGVYEGAEPLVFSRIMAAHWLVPVDALQKIGPFSDLFPYYGQDDDWCHRAHYLGYKIGVVPQARAVHDRAQRQESRERVIDRNYRVGSLVRLCDVNRPLWERFLFVCLFTVVKAVKYRSMLPFKHFCSLCRQLPAIRAHRTLSRSKH